MIPARAPTCCVRSAAPRIAPSVAENRTVPRSVATTREMVPGLSSARCGSRTFRALRRADLHHRLRRRGRAPGHQTFQRAGRRVGRSAVSGATETSRCVSPRESRAVAWPVSRLDSGSPLIRVQEERARAERVPLPLDRAVRVGNGRGNPARTRRVPGRSNVGGVGSCRSVAPSSSR